MSALLLATVGGAPEPIVASLLHWRPARVVFIVTPQTRETVARDILPKVHHAGWTDFDPGRYDIHEITDHQDYSGIVNQLRLLDDDVAAWQRDHSVVEVIADFTGGTKAMSAALALIAGRWSCRISYVGGSERTKGGVGIVVSGREQILHTQNPANALGWLALDTALELLHVHAFAAAHATLQQALRRVTDPARKAELNAVASLAEALADWDRFQHEKALNKLRDLPKHTHNLEAALGLNRARTVLASTARLQTHLQAILDVGFGHPSRDLVLDLLANARRRLDEHRWDDTTARLYRAIEAVAQAKLQAYGFTDTGKIPLEQLPESLRGDWQPLAVDGHLKLGLQYNYTLLGVLGDETAARFKELGLGDPKRSLLVARNSSVLAHGFSPVSKETAEKLFSATVKLAGFTDADLVFFPALKH